MIYILLVVIFVMGVWIWHYRKLYKEQEAMVFQMCGKLDVAMGLIDRSKL